MIRDLDYVGYVGQDPHQVYREFLFGLQDENVYTVFHPYDQSYTWKVHNTQKRSRIDIDLTIKIHFIWLHFILRNSSTMLHLFLAEPFRQIGFPYLITLTLVAIESLLSLLQSFHQGFLRGRFLPFFLEILWTKNCQAQPKPQPNPVGAELVIFPNNPATHTPIQPPTPPPDIPEK